METQSHFGSWLQRCRKEHLHLTQEELAEAVGCSRDMIHKIEIGTRQPSKHLASRLAQTMQIASADQQCFVRFARGILVADADPAQWPPPPQFPPLSEPLPPSVPPPVATSDPPVDPPPAMDAPIHVPVESGGLLRMRVLALSVLLIVVLTASVLVAYQYNMLALAASKKPNSQEQQPGVGAEMPRHPTRPQWSL